MFKYTKYKIEWDEDHGLFFAMDTDTGDTLATGCTEEELAAQMSQLNMAYHHGMAEGAQVEKHRIRKLFGL